MRKSIINQATGKVVNVIELADGAKWTPADGQSIGPDGGEIGMIWTGSSYVPIDPPSESPVF
jgi:hypothetical protein